MQTKVLLLPVTSNINDESASIYHIVGFEYKYLTGDTTTMEIHHATSDLFPITNQTPNEVKVNTPVETNIDGSVDL